MRTTILLAFAVLLTVAVGSPRAGHCCKLGARAATGTALIVTVAAARSSARALTLRDRPKLQRSEAVSAELPVAMEVARLDAHLPVRVRPTWETIGGHARAGFAISGRF